MESKTVVLSNEQLKELRHSYLLADSTLTKALEGIEEGISPSFASLAKSAQHNFSSIVSVLRLPYTLASSSVYEIRKGAAQAMAVEGVHIEEILRFLSFPDIQSPAKKLLEQSIVSLWTIIEILFHDAFELYLNKTPDKVFQLIENEDAKKRLLDMKRLSIDVLVKYKFDISDKIGTILVENVDFSKLANIKACVPPLFKPCPNLIRQLGQSDLWLLNQRRHLFVHKAGIVDREYLKNTGEQLEVGATIYINSFMVEKHIWTVVKLVKALFDVLPPNENRQQEDEKMPAI